MFIEHEKTFGNDVWRKLDSRSRDLLSAQLQLKASPFRAGGQWAFSGR
jgi:hypothetical protein